MFTPFAMPRSTSRDPGVEAHSNSSVSGPALRFEPVCVCVCKREGERERESVFVCDKVGSSQTI